jgi:hypothetical protein
VKYLSSFSSPSEDHLKAVSGCFTDICVFLIGREAKKKALKDRIEREVTDSSEDISADDDDQDSLNEDSDDDEPDTEMQCVKGVIRIMESMLCG